MRETRNAQPSIFECYAKHEMGSDLAMMSALLDRCPAIVDLVESDLVDCEAQRTGRTGLPVESVLRCAVLKQTRQLSYNELAFYLEDSVSFRSFARLPQGAVPKKSALQANIRRIQPETWEQINQTLVQEALSSDLESGEQVRIDSTVVATNVHNPSDSSLLCDGIRILTRQMAKARQSLKVAGVRFNDHRKAARSLARKVFYTRGVARKKPLYEGLLGYSEQVLKESHKALALVERMGGDGPKYAQWAWQVSHTRQLLRQAIEQTRRRVFNDEKVPASEKLVSLHEPHTDIIVKGNRDLQYGHKVNLTTGRRGLVLDAIIESGKPGDMVRYLPMIERQAALYGTVPTAVAADGGYASLPNLEGGKAMGVGEVSFQKKKGLTIEALTSTPAIYQRPCDFRAGIESNISELKRVYGLKRSLWRGLKGFMAEVWSAIFSYNLVKMARLATA